MQSPTHFNNPEFSDLDLVLREPTGLIYTLPAHRVILADNSEFFRGLLSGSFRESRQRQIAVTVPNINEALKLLQSMYTPNRRVPPGTEALAQQWLVPGVFVEEKIPYPGPPGVFGVEDSGLPYRRVVFKSNNHSVIGDFSADAGEDGTRELDVVIYFRPDRSSQLAQYLRQYGIAVSTQDLKDGQYIAKSVKEARTLLQILLDHNEFTERDQHFLESIVEGVFPSEL
jgi:hypothetical protein